MRIGIIGAGAMGQTVGRLLAQGGHTVAVSWSSSEARLRLAAEQIGFGTRTATPIEAVSDADAVLFAPRFEHIRAASLAVGALAGKVVIDTTNPYNPERKGLVDLGGQTAAEYVSALLPGARYVKGFNTLTAGFLSESAHRAGPDRVVIFLSGDDNDAKGVGGTLVRDAGFEPIDLGAVTESTGQDPGGSYYGEEFHLADVPALRRI
jgi:8-hydroxy-5-deazaflavin:NADPH oxidoreductase